jgi:hypothetical protein
MELLKPLACYVRVGLAPLLAAASLAGSIGVSVRGEVVALAWPAIPLPSVALSGMPAELVKRLVYSALRAALERRRFDP